MIAKKIPMIIIYEIKQTKQTQLCHLSKAISLKMETFIVWYHTSIT